MKVFALPPSPLLLALTCLFAPAIYAQKFPISIPAHVDFNGPASFPLRHWVVLGDYTDAAGLSAQVVKTGTASLEVKSGGSVESYLKLEPNSTYQVSVWLKTSSGADEVQMNINGLGENNISVASALADWALIEKTFHTGEDQRRGLIEFKNPANSGHNSAWVDELRIERVGDYTPEKPAGIKPLPPRKITEHLGLSSQPDEKLQWLLDAKFGMFLHWGIYAGTGRAEWAMHQMKMRPEDYRRFAYAESGDAYFSADRYDPAQWAELAKAAGMKYMVLTAMHHDGYALFESRAIDAFTSKQTHNRDFIKEYVEACRAAGLRVGLFKTLINWRYPGYYDWTGTDCKPNVFGYTTNIAHKENARLMKEELYAQTKELMTNYGKIDILFWDGGWLGQQGTSAAGAPFWESGKYLDPNNAWPVNPYFQDFDNETGKPLGLMGIVRKHQPDIIVNPRSGWVGDIRAEEGGARVTGPIRSEYIYEKCMTVAPGWGYTKHYENPEKVMSVDEIKEMLADCVVRNMVFLLNVGPNRRGEIPPLAAERFRGIGAWLEKVGDAVYRTRGGPWNPRDGVHGFTYKDNKIFVYLFSNFTGDTLTLPALNEGQEALRAYRVSDGAPVMINQNGDREVTLSGIDRDDKTVTILAVELNKNVL
ncbi:MAG: alpha-L-fucosidase [Opitutaceae bacterium]|jgi:alpha-L-fucosidase|nr:alpha-L-fucosidase [Opitutaceae bacterium]